MHLTQENGSGELVFTQARALLKDPTTTPDPLADELKSLSLLLHKNGRGEYLRFILAHFISLYCSSIGARIAQLTTAIPAPDLPDKISHLLGGKIYLDTKVDPSIEGGFVLTVGDIKLDASVKGRLERIRKEFISLNSKRLL